MLQFIFSTEEVDVSMIPALHCMGRIITRKGDTMFRDVMHTIQSNHMLAAGQHVILAVSGGADSVSMLYLFHHLRRHYGIQLTIAHLNHKIRGEEADEDAEFVRGLAWRLGCSCVEEVVDVPALAASKGISLEMASREARYSFFAKVVERIGADLVATAHTSDDQAETILLKLARGTGAQGLGGIPHITSINGVEVIRPLLDVSHTDALRFLEKHRLLWREDSSNNDVYFLRNRVRHEILPVFESRLNPQIRRALARTANVLSEENAWMDALARDRMKRCVKRYAPEVLLTDALKAQVLPARRRIIRLWLLDRGVKQDDVDFQAVDRIDDLARRQDGSQSVPLAGGWKVHRRYNEMTVEPAIVYKDMLFCEPVKIPGETILVNPGIRVVTRWNKGVYTDPPVGLGKLPATATLGAEAIGNSQILVRSWRDGDRIRPLGLDGSQKVKKLFVDNKIPRDQRKCIPVFECREEIPWIAGYRVAQGWEVPNSSSDSLHIFVERI